MIWLLLVWFVIGATVADNSLTNTVGPGDLTAMKVTFRKALSDQKSLNDVSYAADGLRLLGDTLGPNEEALCEMAVAAARTDDMDKIYHAVLLATSLSKCQLPEIAAAVLERRASSGSTLKDLCYATETANRLKIKLDANKIRSQTEKLLATHSSVDDLAYGFYVAAHLTGNLEPFLSRFGDCISQADEVDGIYLQYDSNVILTARVVTAIYSLAAHGKKEPPLKQGQLVKFSNYLLAHRRSKDARTAYFVLVALNTIAKNQFHTPLRISLASEKVITPSNRVIMALVTDLFNHNVDGVDLVADEVLELISGSSVVKNKAFTVNSVDKRFRELDLNTVPMQPGIFRLTVSTKTAAGSKALPVQKQQMHLKMMRSIALDMVTFDIVDQGHGSLGSGAKKFVVGKDRSAELVADSRQKMLVRFSVLDKASGSQISVMQAFVQLSHQSATQEATFICTIDSSMFYTLELDFNKLGKEFDHKSGKYDVRIVVADATAENKFNERFAVLQLSLPEVFKPVQSPTEQIVYGKQPEIHHTFRAPDKRPPAVVSDVFTVMSLLPILLLLVLWAVIGANLSGFSFSISGLVFHVSLAAIFGLYVLFWLKLNMFETLKCLGILCCVVFVSGNRLLCNLVQRSATKEG